MAAQMLFYLTSGHSCKLLYSLVKTPIWFRVLIYRCEEFTMIEFGRSAYAAFSFPEYSVASRKLS